MATRQQLTKKLVAAPRPMWRDVQADAKREGKTVTEWVRDAIRIKLEIARTAPR